MDNSDNTKPKTKGKSPKNDKGEEKKYNFRKRKIKKYRTVEESSSEDDSDWIPDEDFIVEEESESEDELPHPPEESMDTLQLQKFIQKIFPSKSGQERLKQLEKIANKYNVKLERIDISEGEAPKELQDIHLDNQIKRAQDGGLVLK